MSCSFHMLAGWLIDGTGVSVKKNVLLRVKNGRIVSLHEGTPLHESGSQWSLKPDFLDFSNYTLVPGLVDSHVHLFMSGSTNLALRRKQLQLPFETARNVISRHLSEHRTHGILAVRDGGDASSHTIRYKYDPRSDLQGVLVRSPGKAWHAPGRYGALIGDPPEEGVTLAQSIFRCLHRTDTLSANAPDRVFSNRSMGGMDHVKIVNSGLNSLVRYARETAPQFDTEELREAVNTAHKSRLKIMVHANGEIPVRRALEAGCDSIEHGFFMGLENLQIMADKQVTWVPTACTMEAYAKELPSESREAVTAARNLEHQLEQLRHALRLGVPVATGSDSGSLGVHHGTSLKDEIRLLIRAGFSLEAALESATRIGSSLLNCEKERGLLLPGLPATFLAFKTPPRELPNRLGVPDSVYINGRSIFSMGMSSETKE